MQTITIKTAAVELLETALDVVDSSCDDYSLKELIDTLADVSGMVEQQDDFMLDLPSGEVRVIRQSAIDKVQQEELESSTYLLGCFNACFIADILEIDTDVIQTMQQAEVFEAIGKLIISTGKLEKLQAEYASQDGYGHHFASYDHEEHESGDFYIFRTN